MNIKCRSQIFVRDNLIIVIVSFFTSIYILYKMRKALNRGKFNRKVREIFDKVKDKLRNSLFKIE